MTPTSSGTRPLFDCLADVAKAMVDAGHVQVFLDFDGTLAPIAQDPAAALLPVETRLRLIDLVNRRRFSVAIISGRSLDDVRKKVGLDGITYAGNHGLEISGPGLEFAEPEALRRAKALEQLSRIVELRMRHVAGTLIENKGLSASVHYRRAHEANRTAIREIVSEAMAPFAGLFRISQGLEVLEIRPKLDWTKGDAARLILSSSQSPDALPVCLGDDATDEDLFAAFPGGITVRVGQVVATAARYQVEFPEQAGEFLGWLTELRDSGA